MYRILLNHTLAVDQFIKMDDLTFKVKTNHIYYIIITDLKKVNFKLLFKWKKKYKDVKLEVIMVDEAKFNDYDKYLPNIFDQYKLFLLPIILQIGNSDDVYKIIDPYDILNK